MGKKGKKKDFSTKEKELLEIENLKLQKREKPAEKPKRRGRKPKKEEVA